MKISRLAIAAVTLFASCNNSDNGLGLLDPDPEANEHIKYFGFTLVDTFWDDPTDTETKTNYSDEVASFSNIADILVLTPTDDIRLQMQGMQQLQMKSILHVSELFFEQEGGNAPSGNDYKLKSNYQDNWDTFVASNELVQNKTLVQTFYLGEEPTWNGITANELALAANYIKASIPDVPIMVIEASAAVNNLQVPDAVDWVGFDHYFVKDPANDSAFKSELETVKSKLAVDQKLVLVMDTHYIDFAHGDFGGIALEEMEEVASNYYRLAKKEKKTIALIGYFWPSGFDEPNAVGARHMPENVKNEYERIGKEITGKN